MNSGGIVVESSIPDLEILSKLTYADAAMLTGDVSDDRLARLKRLSGIRILKSDEKIISDIVLDDRKRIILLCGPPGSGKSTFCEDIKAVTIHPNSNHNILIEANQQRRWVRISQDVLGPKYLKVLRRAIESKCDIIIDRQHAIESQRAQILSDLTKAVNQVHEPYQIETIVFTGGEKGELLDRIKRRTQAGLQKGGVGLVIAFHKTWKAWQPPTYSEGFMRIREIKMAEDHSCLVNCFRSS